MQNKTTKKLVDETGRTYHTALKKGDVGEIVFLPGDPERVPKIAEYFSNARKVSDKRGLVTYSGHIAGRHVSATSTGMGAPSTAIVVEELLSRGAQTLIRVGTCGAINKVTSVGSVVIAEAAVRLEGTSYDYVMNGYPAYASPHVALALEDSAVELKKEYTSGITASTDSFYVGQGRTGFGGYSPSHKENLLHDLDAANVVCLEMESSLLFVLGSIYRKYDSRIRTGALFAVAGNNATGEVDHKHIGVKNAIEIAVKSVERL